MLLPVVLFACGNSTTENLTRGEILKKGAYLYTTNGCNVCHSLDGSIVYGPPLNNIYMKELTVIRDGRERTLKANRDYLMRAIEDPAYEKNLPYRNKEMPPASLPKKEAELLVEYLIALGSDESTN